MPARTRSALVKWPPPSVGAWQSARTGNVRSEHRRLMQQSGSSSPMLTQVYTYSVNTALTISHSNRLVPVSDVTKIICESLQYFTGANPCCSLMTPPLSDADVSGPDPFAWRRKPREIPRCGFEAGILNFGIHVRMGDRAGLDRTPEEFLTRLNGFMDTVTEVTAELGIAQPVFHVFSESQQPCPHADTATFEEFPLWPVDMNEVKYDRAFPYGSIICIPTARGRNVPEIVQPTSPCGGGDVPHAARFERTCSSLRSSRPHGAVDTRGLRASFHSRQDRQGLLYSCPAPSSHPQRSRKAVSPYFGGAHAWSTMLFASYCGASYPRFRCTPRNHVAHEVDPAMYICCVRFLSCYIYRTPPQLPNSKSSHPGTTHRQL